MNVTPLECIGLACVRVTSTGEFAYDAEYVFSNGFDTGTPTGAVAGADPITYSTEAFLLFLSEPVDLGVVAGQGGVVAIASVSGRTATPATAYCTIEYAPALAGGDYVDVDPRKIVAVQLRSGASVFAGETADFTIAVFRNSQTVFAHE